MLDFAYDAVCIVLLEVLSIDLKFHIVHKYVATTSTVSCADFKPTSASMSTTFLNI